MFENQIKEFINKIRPPKEIRDEIDIGYNFEGKAIEIFEIRPDWMDPSKKMQRSFAKARYFKSQDIWRIYWMRASGKWEVYPPCPEVTELADFFKVLEEDEHGCFFG